MAKNVEGIVLIQKLIDHVGWSAVRELVSNLSATLVFVNPMSQEQGTEEQCISYRCWYVTQPKKYNQKWRHDQNINPERAVAEIIFSHKINFYQHKTDEKWQRMHKEDKISFNMNLQRLRQAGSFMEREQIRAAHHSIPWFFHWILHPSPHESPLL